MMRRLKLGFALDRNLEAMLIGPRDRSLAWSDGSKGCIERASSAFASCSGDPTPACALIIRSALRGVLRGLSKVAHGAPNCRLPPASLSPLSLQVVASLQSFTSHSGYSTWRPRQGLLFVARANGGEVGSMRPRSHMLRDSNTFEHLSCFLPGTR